MNTYNAIGRLTTGGLAQSTIQANSYEEALLTANAYIKEVPEIMYIIISNPNTEL